MKNSIFYYKTNLHTEKLFVLFIRLYQKFISPLIPPSCRFIPSCSNYAVEAIQKYGIWKGGLMAVKRILKCHPFHPGGFDPVR